MVRNERSWTQLHPAAGRCDTAHTDPRRDRDHASKISLNRKKKKKNDAVLDVKEHNICIEESWF